MKIHLLLLTLLITSPLFAQEYCDYDTQRSINFGYDSADEPFELLELEDGKYLLAGTSYYISSNHFEAIVCRMNADNTIDETFGENGRVGYTWSQRNTCISAAVQADGKILIGGYQAPGNGVSSFKAYIARLNADGSIDTEFGVDGSKEFPYRGTTVGINITESGKIQAALITRDNPGYALIQMNADGTNDETFATEGVAYFTDNRIYWQTDYGDALFLDDGSTVFFSKAFSSNTTKAYVSKIGADGLQDMDFGEDGAIVYPTAIQYNYAGIHATLDNDGNILIGSTSETAPKHFQVMSISAETGELNTEFGEDGIAKSTNTDSFNTLHGLAVDPSNGDIYAPGTSTTTGWGSSFWKIDASGNEVDICEENAMFTFPFQFSNGLRIASFMADGSLKLIGESGFVDDTTPDDEDQDANFYIPIWSVSGLNELNDDALSIYPNPVADELNLKMDGNIQVTSYQIRNQLGQLIETANQYNQSIKTSHLLRGIYFIEVFTSEGRAVRKFIKQ